MIWHSDLADAVSQEVTSTSWVSVPTESFSVSARPKTVDTLVQKLRRTTLTLDQVQDIAGVRVDAEMTLTQQTALANEIADHFGRDAALVKDIRDDPHSGYRAVHVWLRLPAGRVEIQLRTILQSAWANAYERLGDRFGRGIRYDEEHGSEEARFFVNEFLEVSRMIAGLEQQHEVVLGDSEVTEQRAVEVWTMTTQVLRAQLDRIARSIDERGRE